MTGNEIIAAARVLFGETTALTVDATAILSFLNEALKDIYKALPNDELLPELEQTAAVALTSGKGDLPADLDELVLVDVGDEPAVQVSPAAFARAGGYPILVPSVPVFTTDGTHIWIVSDSSGNTCNVHYLAPPDELETGDLTSEVVLPSWHHVLVLLVASRAYAQEEDLGMARHLRDTAFALMNKTAPIAEEAQS